MKRLTLLKNAYSQFERATQFLNTDLVTSSNSLVAAESIISILEVEDCGSVGGFDKSNKVINVTNHRIFDRFLTVLRKYDDLKSFPEIDYLTCFYTKLASLRDF